jgi:nicotinamidase-related amidase
VVVTGVVAECCVLSTVMELIDAGIYTVYLTDGVSGLDREKEAATELILSG